MESVTGALQGVIDLRRRSLGFFRDLACFCRALWSAPWCSTVFPHAARPFEEVTPFRCLGRKQFVNPGLHQVFWKSLGRILWGWRRPLSSFCKGIISAEPPNP